MKPQQRGSTNERRTVDFLVKQGWVAVGTKGSAGMMDCDVMAYHMHTGNIKHIQAKSNHHFNRNDVERLRTYKNLVTAANVSFEIWDWMDNQKYPIVTILGENVESDLTKHTNPKIEEQLRRWT